MTISLYFTVNTNNMVIKSQQQRIIMVLTAQNIPYEVIDVRSSQEAQKEMEDVAGDDVFPPQIANNGVLCGNFKLFEEAVADKKLREFLKLN